MQKKFYNIKQKKNPVNKILKNIKIIIQLKMKS